MSIATTKERERTKSIAHDAATCRHFTGLYYKICKVGISYESVKDSHPERDDLAPYYRESYPCLPDDGSRSTCRTICEKLERPTVEEATREYDEREARFHEHMQNIADNICPTHKIAIEKKQVGKCVYAEPCGCRLYQGTIPKQ